MCHDINLIYACLQVTLSVYLGPSNTRSYRANQQTHIQRQGQSQGQGEYSTTTVSSATEDGSDSYMLTPSSSASEPRTEPQPLTTSSREKLLACSVFKESPPSPQYIPRTAASANTSTVRHSFNGCGTGGMGMDRIACTTTDYYISSDTPTLTPTAFTPTTAIPSTNSIDTHAVCPSPPTSSRSSNKTESNKHTNSNKSNKHNTISSRTTNSVEQYITIEVADNGIGIPVDKVDTLFAPFKQTQRFAGGMFILYACIEVCIYYTVLYSC